MAIRHETSGTYMLQVRIDGNWHDVDRVAKSGGSNTCRVTAKRTGNTHRVINKSKGNAIYCEIDPT